MTAILILALAFAQPAAASPAARSAHDARAQEARKACAAGQVERGIQLLADIIAETSDPNALYNQGRCYQQNGRAEEAISRFREYLRIAKSIPAEDARTVEGYIKELEAELDAEARRATAAAPDRAPSAARLAGGGVPATASPLRGPAGSGAAADRADHASRSLRVAGLALGVASVAALAAGTYFALRVKTLNDRIADRSTRIGAENYAAWSKEGERAEVLQWVGYGVSAAALAGAVTCYLLSRGPERYAAAAAPPPPVLPVFDRAGAGAVLRLTF